MRRLQAVSSSLVTLLLFLAVSAHAAVGLKRPTENARTEQFGQFKPNAGIEFLGLDTDGVLGFGVYSVDTGDRLATLLNPLNQPEASRIQVDMNDDGVSEILGLFEPDPYSTTIGLQKWSSGNMVEMFPKFSVPVIGLKFVGLMRLNSADPHALVFTTPTRVFIVLETGTVRYDSGTDSAFPNVSNGTLEAFIGDFDADGFDEVCLTYTPPNGSGTYRNILIGDTNPTANVASEPVGTRARLLTSWPNPSSGAARIAFEILRPAQVQMQIYDASGRLMNRLANGPMGAGLHECSWDGRDLSGRRVAGGVYFYQLVVDGVRETRKLVQLR